MNTLEPTAEEDFATIVAELERVKAENRRLAGVKGRAIPAGAAEAYVARMQAHNATAPIPFHRYAELLKQVNGAQKLRAEFRAAPFWAALGSRAKAG